MSEGIRSWHAVSAVGLGGVNSCFTLMAAWVMRCQVGFAGSHFTYTTAHGSASSYVESPVLCCLERHRCPLADSESAVTEYKWQGIENQQVIARGLKLHSEMQNSRILFEGNIPYTPISHYKVIISKPVYDPVK